MISSISEYLNNLLNIPQREIIKKGMKKIILNWIALSISVLLCILFMEILFRLLIFSNLFTYLPEFQGYKESHLPGVYYTAPPLANFSPDIMQCTTNSMGFRTKEYNPETKSIIALGDSVTFGYGVNDSQVYPYLLEKKINNDYSVYNFAVPGHTTFQYYSVFKHYAKHFKPDIIILGLYSNDLRSVGYDCKYDLDLIRKNSYLIDNTRFFLHSNSILYQIINYKLSKLNCLPNNKKDKAHYDIFFFERSLQLINDYSKKNDIPFYVVLLPTPINNRTLERLELYNGMLNFLNKNNISYIDIASDYPNVSGNDYRTGIFMEDDGTIDDHPSTYGHKLITESIFNNIKNDIY